MYFNDAHKLKKNSIEQTMQKLIFLCVVTAANAASFGQLFTTTSTADPVHTYEPITLMPPTGQLQKSIFLKQVSESTGLMVDVFKSTCYTEEGAILQYVSSLQPLTCYFKDDDDDTLFCSDGQSTCVFFCDLIGY